MRPIATSPSLHTYVVGTPTASTGVPELIARYQLSAAVSAPGAPAVYAEWPSADDGRPVLLLHGFPETSASWAAVTPRLTEAGLRTYAVDQLGYSPGARPAEVEAYALTNLAQVTADLMTAMDVPVADVVGHDWGANVAWALAAWHPDRVRSLTAVSVPHPTAFTAAWRSDPELG